MEAKKSNRVREILKLQYILKKWEKVANASKQANNNNNSNEEEKQASEEDNPPQMLLSCQVRKEEKTNKILTDYYAPRNYKASPCAPWQTLYGCHLAKRHQAFCS
ncbi:hypothetical protein YC2023_059686 [Brassica napus]